MKVEALETKSAYWNFQGKWKLVRKIRGRITVLDWLEENDLLRVIGRLKKNEGSRNGDSTVDTYFLWRAEHFWTDWADRKYCRLNGNELCEAVYIVLGLSVAQLSANIVWLVNTGCYLMPGCVGIIPNKMWTNHHPLDGRVYTHVTSVSTLELLLKSVMEIYVLYTR